MFIRTDDAPTDLHPISDDLRPISDRSPTDLRPPQVFSKAIDGVGQLKLGGTAAIAAGPIGRDAALDARLSQASAC